MFDWINLNQVSSVIRSVLIAASSYLIGKGILSEEQAMQIIGWLVPLAMAIWGVVTKTSKQEVKRAAAIVAIPAASQARVGIEAPIQPAKGPKV